MVANEITVIYTSCLIHLLILLYVMSRQDLCFLFIRDTGIVVPQFKQIISQAAHLDRIKAVTEKNNPDSIQSNKVHTYKGHGRFVIIVTELKVTICRCSFLRNSQTNHRVHLNYRFHRTNAY